MGTLARLEEYPLLGFGCMLLRKYCNVKRVCKSSELSAHIYSIAKLLIVLNGEPNHRAALSRKAVKLGRIRTTGRIRR